MNDVLRRIMVRGRVQGVGYRAFVAEIVAAHGLAGWVRNRRDGSVEAVFEGTEDTVANMIASCRNGPPSGRVDEVAVETAHADELGLRRAGEAFSVLPTI